MPELTQEPVRLAKRLTAAAMIDCASHYMQQKFGHYEPSELLDAIDLAREWVADQIARKELRTEKEPIPCQE